jgi:CRP/FNR family transcriptional regulator, cyclic AMP receptor protein
MPGEGPRTSALVPRPRFAGKSAHARLLSGLPARLSRELFAGAELVQLSAGQVLYRTGDSGNGCYRIEDGLLKITMVSNSGTERILAFLGRSAMIGELSVIDGLPRSVSVVAVRDATLSFVSRAAFGDFTKKHPELCQSLLRLLAKRVRERDKMVAATSFLSLKGRIAQTLPSWRKILAKKLDRSGSSSVKKSGRPTLLPWPALHARP